MFPVQCLSLITDEEEGFYSGTVARRSQIDDSRNRHALAKLNYDVLQYGVSSVQLQRGFQIKIEYWIK